MRLCEQHGLMNGAHDYTCPYCRIAELGAENERLRDLLRMALPHVSAQGDATLETLIVQGPCGRGGVMDIGQYKILCETYREAIQDCLDVSYAAIHGKAVDRFKVARVVYEITNEVLDEEPEKKNCPMCGQSNKGKGE